MEKEKSSYILNKYVKSIMYILSASFNSIYTFQNNI